MGTVVINGNTYTVYGTEAAANVYLAASPLHATAWDEAEVEDRRRALVSATRMLDASRWQGARTSTSQALKFPRTGLVDEDGVAVSSSVVPTRVEEACYELAAVVLATPSTPAKALGSNIAEVDGDGPKVKFFRPVEAAEADPFPRPVMGLVGLWLEGAGSTLTGGERFGCGDSSSFDDDYHTGP